MILKPTKKIPILLLLCLSLILSSCSNTTDLTNDSDGETAKGDVQSNAPVSETPSSEESDPVTESPHFTEAFSDQDRIYFIMVDRFNDSNPDNNLPDVDPNDPLKFQGGDINGITQKLDYIQSMGFTTLWLTPIMKNTKDGYHGYWIDDFESVDPHFGTMDDLKNLVKEAHRRDMKVILDYVVNHTGIDSEWLNDPEKKDWFHPQKNISNWTDQDEVEKGWLSGLPDLDQSNPKVHDYFINNALWWIDETQIDGFRLDTVKHVPHEYWKDFTHAIKTIYPDFYFLGEVWSENPRYIELYHQDGIDGLTDYSLYNGLTNAFSSTSNIDSLVNALKLEKYYSHPELNGIFLDNHDNPRLVSTNGQWGEAYLKQALAFIYTYPSIPVVYYGTEIALQGGADPENRHFMPWDETADNPMIDYVKALSDIKTQYTGTFQVLQSDKKEWIYQISNPDNEDRLLVIMNTDKKELSLSVTGIEELANLSLTNYFDDTDSFTTNANGDLSITLAPVSVNIYKVNAQ